MLKIFFSFCILVLGIAAIIYGIRSGLIKREIISTRYCARVEGRHAVITGFIYAIMGFLWMGVGAFLLFDF